MKYMLMMNTPGGGPYQITSWPKQDIEAHMEFMRGLNKKLVDAGELVGGEGLSRPGSGEARARGRERRADHRRRVSRVEGIPRRVLDRRRRDARARLRDRGRSVGGTRPGGEPLRMAIEVRQVMSAPPT